MLIIKVVSVALVALFLSVVVRHYRAEYSVFISLSAAVIIWMMMSDTLSRSLDTLKIMLEGTGIESGYVSIVFKTLGICILTQIASDVCRDAGESALATKTEFAGKIVILAVALPMLTSIAQISIELINR
ncbi:MAG: stage III sporulation protein AD [Clostridia bacterium]|nr:stage III sporulation protein AD [Clostridia bacterium]